MMEQGTTYRCYKDCPLHKRCFVIKVRDPLTHELTVYQKCPAEKGRDIELTFGKERPP